MLPTCVTGVESFVGSSVVIIVTGVVVGSGGVGSVSKICLQCASCCAGDIWENTVGSGENGGGGVCCGGVCSRFCGDVPSL